MYKVVNFGLSETTLSARPSGPRLLLFRAEVWGIRFQIFKGYGYLVHSTKVRNFSCWLKVNLFENRLLWLEVIKFISYPIVAEVPGLRR